jgi:hypothetical protein
MDSITNHSTSCRRPAHGAGGHPTGYGGHPTEQAACDSLAIPSDTPPHMPDACGGHIVAKCSWDTFIDASTRNRTNMKEETVTSKWLGSRVVGKERGGYGGGGDGVRGKDLGGRRGIRCGGRGIWGRRDK